jgi:hypothetical protein
VKVIKIKLTWDQAVDAMHRGLKISYWKAPDGWYIYAPTPGRHRFVDHKGREFWPTRRDHLCTYWQVVE